jgi:hypothetical protein
MSQTTQAAQRAAPPIQLKKSAQHSEGYLYYSDTMQFPAGIKEDWEGGKGKKGLKARIQKKIGKIETPEAPLACDLLMASDVNDPNTIRPSVVIRCVSQGIREKIEQSLKHRFRSDVVDSSRYALRILIDKIFGELAAASAWTSQLSSALNTKSPRQSNVAVLQERPGRGRKFTLLSSDEVPTTFCGCGIVPQLVDGTMRPADATLGGVISIDGKLYGLTTGHLFASLFPPPAATPQPYEDDLPTSSDEDDTDNGFPGVAHPPRRSHIHTAPQSSAAVESPLGGETQRSSRSPMERPPSKHSITDCTVLAGALAGRYFVSPLFEKAASELRSSSRGWCDWALLKFPIGYNVPPNTYSAHGDDNIPINDVENEEDLIPGPVSIIGSKSGTLQGHLSDTTGSTTLRGHQYNVRRIGLSKSLGSLSDVCLPTILLHRLTFGRTWRFRRMGSSRSEALRYHHCRWWAPPLGIYVANRQDFRRNQELACSARYQRSNRE